MYLEKKIEIESKYYSSVANFFSPIVINKLITNKNSSYFSEVCYNSGILKNINLSISMGEFLDLVFKFLIDNYRNEYVYKNIIANKILLGKYSLNTSKMLTEFRVGPNKADAVILNGSATVYEIKTEYDSLSRLENQLKSYMMAFEYVNVITSPTQIEKVLHFVPQNVGVLSFSRKKSISTIRKPSSNFELINLEFLFDSLRKDEYLEIIETFYRETPKVPNTKIRQVCKTLFSDIQKDKAVELFITTLKKRNNSPKLNFYIEQTPYSMKSYVLNIGSNKIKLKNLMDIFNEKLVYFMS